MKLSASQLQLLVDVAEGEVVWDPERSVVLGTVMSTATLGAVESRGLIDYLPIEGERYRSRVVLTDRGAQELGAAEGVFV